jgi:O-antigen/teichoic acid export membrane protein
MRSDRGVRLTVDLKKKTVNSILWSVARVGWTTLSSFVLFVVLTRLLDPVAFGLFALCSTFVEFARVLASAGLSDAVTREEHLSEEMADTAFWSNLGFSLVVVLLVLVCAGPYARFMGQPGLVPILFALSPLMVLGALHSIHNARLLRDFGHKAVALRTVGVTVAASGLAIGAAFLGWGVWSLVVQAAVTEVVTTVFTWRLYRWVPKFRFSVPALKKLLGFSFSMVLTQMLWVLLGRMPEIFIGRYLGAAEVGRYRIAWRLIDLLAQSVLGPIGSVGLVTLSRVQSDLPRFQKIYAQISASAALLTFPLMLGFGAVADELIPLVFGPQWRGNGDLVRVLALMVVPFTVNYFTAPALAAVGQSRSILKVASLQLVLTLLFSWIAAPYGLAAIALAYVIRANVTMPYQLWVLQKHTGVNALASLKAMLPPLLMSIVMAVATYFAAPYIQAWLVRPWPAMLALVAFGGALYGVMLFVFAREQVRAVFEVLLPKLRKTP